MNDDPKELRNLQVYNHRRQNVGCILYIHEERVEWWKMEDIQEKGTETDQVDIQPEIPNFEGIPRLIVSKQVSTHRNRPQHMPSNKVNDVAG